jgi:putative phosphoribosyl transferase
MGLMIVRKLQIPNEPEAGFGAVTLNGQLILNEELVAELGLTPEDIRGAREKAMGEGRSRDRALRGDREPLPLAGRTIVLVDDGLASGYTMLAAIGQVKGEHPDRIIVAVPTGSKYAVQMVAEEVNMLICLNIRRGRFAVADAYRHWYDLTEEEAVATLRTVI